MQLRKKLKILMEGTSKPATLALQLLEDVPSEKFVSASFEANFGRHCALGFINKFDFKNKSNIDKGLAGKLYRSSIEFMKEEHKITDTSIMHINDSASYNGYNEPVIKDRVVHLLKDMIENGY